MTVEEFLRRAIDEYAIEYEENKIEGGNNGILVLCPHLKTAAHFPYFSIQNNDWSKLQPSIHQGKDVVHVTRVCGYSSRIANWNPSKIGELKDRHNGMYSLGDKRGSR